MTKATRSRLGWCAYALMVLGFSVGTSKALGQSEASLTEAPCDVFAPPYVVSSSNSRATWTSCTIFVDQPVTVRSNVTIAPGATVTLRQSSHEEARPAKLRIEGRLIANGVSFRTRSSGGVVELTGAANELTGVTLYDAVQLAFRGSSDNRIENLFVAPTEERGSPLSFEGGRRNLVANASASRLKGDFVAVTLGAEVSIQDSEIVASAPVGTGIRIAKGARVELRRSLVSGFAMGIEKADGALIVEDSAIVGNRTAGIAVTNPAGEPAVVRHSFFANNGGTETSREASDDGVRTSLLSARVAATLARITQ